MRQIIKEIEELLAKLQKETDESIYPKSFGFHYIISKRITEIKEILETIEKEIYLFLHT